MARWIVPLSILAFSVLLVSSLRCQPRLDAPVNVQAPQVSAPIAAPIAASIPVDIDLPNMPIQIGPTSSSGPVIDVDAQAKLDACLARIGDLVASVGDIVNTLNLGVSTAVNAPSTQVTSQAANPSAAASQSSGRDSTQNVFAVNASGSGWAIVALAGLACLMFWAWARSHAHVAEARRSGNALAGAAIRHRDQVLAIARAVSQMPAGKDRDELLGRIEIGLDPSVRQNLDELLQERGLYVARAK